MPQETLQALHKVNTLNVDGNGNINIQGVDNSNISLNVSVSMEDFVERFTAGRQRELDNVYQQIEELRELGEFKTLKNKKLQEEARRLKAEMEKREAQVKELLAQAEKANLAEANVLYQEAFALFLQGELEEALTKLRADELQRYEDEVLQKRQKENEEIAKNRMLRAQILGMTQQNQEAESNYERALEFYRSGENLFAYGFFLQENMDFGRSRTLFEEALPLYSAQAAEHKDPQYKQTLAAIYNNLANTYLKQRYFEAAEQYYEEGIKLRRTLMDEQVEGEQVQLAIALDNLGLLYSSQGKYQEAIATVEESLAISELLAKSEDENHLSNFANALVNLGFYRYNTGELHKTEQHYLEALAIRRKMAEKNERFLPSLSFSLYNLAAFLETQNRLEEALPYAEEAYGIRKNLVAKNREKYLFDWANSNASLANICYKKQEYAKVEHFMHESLEAFRELHAAQSRVYEETLVASLLALSNFYMEQMQYLKAQELLPELIHMQEVLQHEKPIPYRLDLAKSYNALGICLLNSQSPLQAALYYKQALEIYREAAQTDSLQQPNVATLLSNLAHFYAHYDVNAALAWDYLKQGRAEMKNLDLNVPQNAETLSRLDEVDEALILLGD